MKCHKAYFVIKSQDLEIAKEIVEKSLNFKLNPHESSFWGGDYYRFDSASLGMTLFCNRDIYDGEPIRTECETGKIVLEIESNKEPFDELIKTLCANPSVQYIEKNY